MTRRKVFTKPANKTIGVRVPESVAEELKPLLKKYAHDYIGKNHPKLLFKNENKE